MGEVDPIIGLFPGYGECEDVVVFAAVFTLYLTTVVADITAVAEPPHSFVGAFEVVVGIDAVVLPQGVECRFHAVVEEGVPLREVDYIEGVACVGLHPLNREVEPLCAA